MSAGSSRRKLIAVWDPTLRIWTQPQEHDSFFELSAPYSETWPASGSMRNGRSYALRRSALPISGNACSSSLGQLLPTPTTKEHNGPGKLDGPRNDTLRARIANLPTPRARDHKGPGYEDTLPSVVKLLKTPTAQLAVNGGSQHPDKRKAGGHGPTLADEVEFLLPSGAGAKLLPTPTATPYGNNQSASPGAAVRPSLDSLAPALLPTPRATDGTKGGPNQRGSKGDLMLPSAAAQISSGATTRPPSASGSTSSDAPPHGQLTIEVA